MTDYHPLMSRAVSALERKNGENRRALYESARSALMARLHAVVPKLSHRDITRERLALEEAIRRVEAEFVRHLAVPRRLPPAEMRADAGGQVHLALRRAIYPIVLLGWTLSVGLLLSEGWFWPGGWDGKIALALALLWAAVQAADRLHARLRRRQRVTARNRAAEASETWQGGSEAAQVALANQRATALLLENLSGQQRRQYAKHRYFDVTGGESGKRYRIWHRPSMNVQELDALGEPKWIWCFHPVGVVICDVLLAQKMALELFEMDAIRIANRFSVRPYGVR